MTDLTIVNLPSHQWGHGALAEVAPALTSVNFSAAGTLWLDGGIGPSVRNMTLTAAEIGGPIRLPVSLDQLTICLLRGTDDDVATLLSGVRHLRSLSLRGTPVTDAIIPVIERYDLSRLDLVSTATTEAALSRFQADHPGTDVYPRTPSFSAADLTRFESPYDHEHRNTLGPRKARTEGPRYFCSGDQPSETPRCGGCG